MLSSRSSSTTTTLTTFSSNSAWFTGKDAKPIKVKQAVVKVKKVIVPKLQSTPTPSDCSSSSSGNTKYGSNEGTRAPVSTASTSSLSSLTSLSSVASLSNNKVSVAQRAKLSLSHSLSSSRESSAGPRDASHSRKRRALSPDSTATRPKKVKRDVLEADKTRGRGGVGLSVSQIDAQDVYRNSRSRSATAFDRVDAPPVSPLSTSTSSKQRKTWCDEDGSVAEGFVSCEMVIKRLMHKYKAYFHNPHKKDDKSFEPHPTDYPSVELEYPNDNASERFILLEPKDKDHYNPIMCLETSLHTLIRNYLTPEQKLLFGTLPEDALKVEESKAVIEKVSAPVSSISDVSSLTSLSSHSHSSSLSSLTAITPSRSSSPALVTDKNLLRSLSRAKHTRNGPMFIETMKEINKLIRELKSPHDENGKLLPNPLRARPREWSISGIPAPVTQRIVDETYQRTIGPNIDKLRRYSPFTSQVYGELMPSFTSEIIKAARLRPGKLYLDLGSGVGNTVLQAALESGCKSFGIELMDSPAELAELQLQQMKMRCKMWGVAMGDVQLVNGDMVKHPRVDELMSKADVVLVNNYVFKEELNAALRPKFLDLKEGAIVVSLKPFAPPTNQRMTERNIDDISAIFDVTARPYHSGTVSWSSGSGQWYIHRVDRQGYSHCREEYERVQSSRRRGRR